MSFKFIM